MEYLIYGANGYTGKLIIEEGLRKGHKPVLAGRSKESITLLSEKYQLPFKVFSLEEENLEKHIEGFPFVMNAAGPFEKTAMPLVNACIKAGIHYLDITGEISVFEDIQGKSEQALDAGIMLLPGIGFDVVPTDCLAGFLKSQLPDASHLELAFTTEGSGMSHGTASTAVSQLGEEGFIRSDGELTKVQIAHKSKTLNFGEVSRTVATIPWGDISTAYHSTKIPNIEVYTAMPKNAIRFMKMGWLFNPIMRSDIVKRIAQKWVDKNIDGPTYEEQQNGFALLYGSVSNGHDKIVAYLRCPEVYRFTALAACLIAEKVYHGNYSAGYQTPSSAFGWKLIQEIDGCAFYDV